jgi:large subunit ribosomal protein L13
MIIDAQDQTLGRLLAYAAKKALTGETVAIVNAEKAVVSGKKERVLGDNLKTLEIKNKGNYTRGPFHYKRPDRYVKKAVRGMLPYNKPRGVDAFDRISVFIGVPEGELQKHNIDIKKEKPVVLKFKKHFGEYVTVGEICAFIGGSW